MRTAQEPTGAIHLVTPSLPTSHFTPGGIVPVTLRILTTTTVPRQHASATSPPVAVASNDLYVRLALVRKVYIRDATHAMAQEAEWNLTPADDDVVWERWCVSEEEVVSRWGWVRGEERGGATEVVMRDIALPLTSAWRHGYSTGLDLIPQPRPSLEPGSPSSFFAPVLEALAMAPARSHDRHLHVASRYFVSIEVGFHSNQVTDGGGSGGQRLADVLHHVPGLHIPPSSSFTAPVAGRRGPNPFPAPASSASLFGGGPQPGSGGAGNRRSSTLGASGHPMAMFPGKLRELLIVRGLLLRHWIASTNNFFGGRVTQPVTIGSSSGTFYGVPHDASNRCSHCLFPFCQPWPFTSGRRPVPINRPCRSFTYGS